MIKSLHNKIGFLKNVCSIEINLENKVKDIKG